MKQVKITWVSSEDGGRQQLFAGTEYRPTVRFLSGDDLEKTHWSVSITIPDDSKPGEAFLGTLSMFSENEEPKYLTEGSEFKVYEGARVVAKGVVV